jgi:hypothetical protein
MYAKITNGQVAQFPYTEIDLLRENPFTSFPKIITDELLGSYGVIKVVRAELPEFDEASQKIVDGDFPVLIDGVWTIQRTVVGKSELEVGAELKSLKAAMRSKRNQLLSACDWTQVGDVPEATKAAWGPYRQALRDVPLQQGFPRDIVWPKKPVIQHR